LAPDLRVVHVERHLRRKRLAVHLSDAQTLSLTPDVAARFRLAPGGTVTHGRLEEITRAQAHEDAMAAALRLVAFRPRSEKEMRQALARRSVPPVLRDEVVSRLRELGLLDDAAFAASFVESRDRGSPRSRRLLAQELRQKGIAREVASLSADAVDDADAAYRAAERRAGSMRGLAFPDFERRLGGFLLRRGFSYETTRGTVRRLWQAQRDQDEEEALIPPTSP
jgi:regulatory protein